MNPDDLIRELTDALQLASWLLVNLPPDGTIKKQIDDTLAKVAQETER